jgi:hypothetical protein
MRCNLRSLTNCHLFLLLYFVISILIGCSKVDSDTNSNNNTPGFILKSLEPSINNIKADRINLILVGKGYRDTSSFLATARRDLAIDGKEIIDPNSFDKVLFGLFTIEPFKGNISKFNIWYYPEQITSDAITFIQNQRNKANTSENDFGLKNASYIIFTNPEAELNSFAFPSNILPKQPINKQNIIFGSTNVARYPNIADGMAVVAHELGHSLFNLRDEYVRTGPTFTDKYGFNIAPSLSEAKVLWGSVENQIDPFYYTWREKRKNAGYWIDKTQPFLIGKDKTTNESIYTWQPSEEDIRVGYFEGGGITTTGISWRPTMTSLMSNEDVRDKSWPQFPPVFGSANRKVMEDVLKIFSGQ